MSPSPFASAPPRLPLGVIVLLAALYLLAGIAGHDPLKTEDAIHVSIALGFITDGHWLFPYVAGEPWPHTAPLYHWIAALLGKVLGSLFDFDDAARLATTLFGALFLGALSGAARAFSGAAAGRLAPLLAIGTLGLLLPLHDAQPAIAGLACAALAWWGGGLCLQPETARRGALLLGLGTGLAFPAHGLAGLMMALAVLPAPTLRRDWKGIGLALLVAMPLIAAWPMLLARHAPDLWAAWWHNEFAEATLARTWPRQRHIEQILWATWPVLPLALWSLWLHRHRFAPLRLPALGVLLGFVWFLSGSPRDLGLLPSTIPLLLLAAAGADRLRRGAANAFDWFGLMTTGFFAALIWLGASAQAFGWPPAIARNFAKLMPDYAAHFGLAALAFALTASIAWLLTWRLPKAPWRATLHWATGITLLWCLLTTLWLPWIDRYKSYRPLAASLHAALPQHIDCIARSGISTAERAQLDYFAGIRTLPEKQATACGWRLVSDTKNRPAPEGWIEVWRGERPSDRKERWYLDRRID